jgi:hypothetical protein
MGILHIRHTAALAAVILIASCAQHQPSSPQPSTPARTITFHNHGRDRIQVYLVGEKENWLLGRLEPMESARLRLPESVSDQTREAMVLAVLPGWSRNLAPSRDRHAALSMTEVGMNLPDEEWSFVNDQVLGPRR